MEVTAPLVMGIEGFMFLSAMLLRPVMFLVSVMQMTPSLDGVFLILWTFLVGYFRSEIVMLGMAHLNIVIFVVAVACVLWAEHVSRNSKVSRWWNRTFVRNSLLLAIYVSLPLVLWYYGWFGLVEKLPCVMRVLYGQNASIGKTWRPMAAGVAVALLLLTILYLSTQKRAVKVIPAILPAVNNSAAEQQPHVKNNARSPTTYENIRMTRSMTRLARANATDLIAPPQP